MPAGGGQRLDHAFSDRAVETERQILAHQHRAGVQPAARRFDLAGQHFSRAAEEEQIVRPLIDHRQHQRRAGAASGAADPLQVTGGGGGDRTQQGAGQVADVDAHFQRRGGGQHVRIIGMAAVIELILERFPFFGGQQTGMLLREHAA